MLHTFPPTPATLRDRRIPLILLLCLLIALVLSTGAGASPGGAAPAALPYAGNASAITFASSALSVDESAGTATLTISRTGDLSGALTAQVEVAERSATPAFDYHDPTSVVDSTFAPALETPVTMVHVLARAPEDKIIVAGEFVRIDGVRAGGVARLNADGSLDTSFGNPRVNYEVSAAATQDDGKVLIAGVFTSVSGEARAGLARLNADGSLDASFDPRPDGRVMSMVAQPDGKIVVAGSFNNIAGAARRNLARLNPDGSVDATFNPSAMADSMVLTVALQTDGAILIGGLFDQVNGTTANRIARLTPQGVLDPTFVVGAGPAPADATINKIVPDQDGTLLVGGKYTTFDGLQRPNLVRLRQSGGVDTTFSALSGEVSNIALQHDGRILISQRYGQGLRLLSDGSREWAITPDSGFANTLIETAQQKVLVGGYFQSIGGVTRRSLAQLNANGSLDMGRDFGLMSAGRVDDLAVQPDGKLLVGGDFTLVNGVSAPFLARLNSDGSRDASFVAAPEVDSPVVYIVLQDDGKLLVTGQFGLASNEPLTYLRRLNADGSLDPTFDGAIVTSWPWELHPLSDGKILILGELADSNLYQSFARLNADGTLDESFTPDLPAPYYGGVDVLPDGKILVAGVRLHPDGSRDSSFTSVPLGTRLVALPDGTSYIISIGPFDDGSAGIDIARFNADGTRDETFATSTENGLTPWELAVQPDGKPIIAAFNGSSDGLRRYNLDGSRDTSLRTGAGGGSNEMPVYAVAIGPQAELYIGGYFKSFDHVPQENVARLQEELLVSWGPGDGTPRTITIPLIDDLLDEPDEHVTFQLTLREGTAAVGPYGTTTLTIRDDEVTPTPAPSATPRQTATRAPTRTTTATRTATSAPSTTTTRTATATRTTTSAPSATTTRTATVTRTGTRTSTATPSDAPSATTTRTATATATGTHTPTARASASPSPTISAPRQKVYVPGVYYQP